MISINIQILRFGVLIWFCPPKKVDNDNNAQYGFFLLYKCHNYII